MDEVRQARRFAQKRGDTGPMAAIGEKALSVFAHRRWEGAFQNIERWDTWKRAGRVPSRVDVSIVQSTVSSLDVVAGTPGDHALVLVTAPISLGEGQDPRFVIVGWAFAGDVEHDKYWRPLDNVFSMPHGDLRSPWELRKQRRQNGRRLNPQDPADDFAGHGKWPGMLDTDDGRHPKHYGNIIRSKWALPCRRCQRLVPAGALSGGNMRTGNIHGDPKECGFAMSDD